MITAHFINNQLHLICNGTIDSSEMQNWMESNDPQIVYTECWNGVITPTELLQTPVGQVTREIFGRVE